MPTRRTCLVVLAMVLVTLAHLGCPSTPSGPLNGWNFALYSQNVGDVISQNANGGYFVAGTAWIEGQLFQYFALTVGPNGVLESTFSLPGVFSQARSGPDATALQATDGSLYFAGLTQYPSGPDSAEGRLRVVRTDRVGNVHWDYNYGDAHWVPRAIVETPDGCAAIAVEKIAIGFRPEMILKLAPSGEVLWLREIPEANSLFGMRSAVAADDGRVVAAGYDNSGDTDAALWAVDEEGNHLWYYRYDRPGWHSLWDVTAAPDGGFYACGRFTLPSGKDRPYLLKVDRDGVFEWDREDIYLPAAAGSDVEIWDMVVDDEGYIAIVGDEEIVEYVPGVPLPVIRNNCFMMRLDAQGNLVWKKDFPGFLYALTATTQGTYMATGVTGTSKRYLIRLIELDKTGKVVN